MRNIRAKALKASGRTYICSTCLFKSIILDYIGCKQCQKHFLEAYEKGYKQALKDEGTHTRK